MTQQIESTGSVRSFFGTFWQSMKETFLMRLVSDEDGNQFTWSSIACGMATIVQMFILYAVYAVTNNAVLEQTWKQVDNHKLSFVILYLVWAITVLASL